MRKIFLLLFCLIFLPPVWASEELYGEISNDYMPYFSQEEIPIEEEVPPQDAIALFSEGEVDNNTNPYHNYNGRKRKVLKGSIRYKNEETGTIVAKDGASLTIKPQKKEFGELQVGNSSSYRDSLSAFLGYNKGRFSIIHSFERSEFKKELARNTVSVEPELRLSKNLKVKSSFRSSQGQKGYTQGVALEYGKTDSRFKKVNNLKFELKATTTLSADSDPVKRFTFNTKYQF